MTDYQKLMRLLVEQRSYREIAAGEGCSQRPIAKARRVLDQQQLDSVWQIDVLTVEDLDRFFTDGRKHAPEAFVPVDIEKIVAARMGRKQLPLKG